MSDRITKKFVPVMLTPFDGDGKIDFNGLTRLTEFYIDSGASGLFSNCLSSEMFELSEEERIDLVRHVVKVSGGAVNVVASGTFVGTLQSQADFVKKIYETGAEAVIVLANMLAGKGEPDEVFNNNMYKLLELTKNIPLGFYECPDPYKRLITPQQISLFGSTNRIVYLKDTCMNLGQVKQKIEAGEGSGIELYDAYMGHAVASLRSGAAGLSCIQGNYWPELIVWLCKNYDNPILTREVDEVQQFFFDKMEVMHDVYPVTAKYYLQKRGFSINTFTRRIVGNFTKDIENKMVQLYSDYNNLMTHLDLNFKAR